MIKSTEDANKYYQVVNQYVDEYVEKWKIKPNNLKNYLLGNKSRLVNFLERKGLKEVTNINQVISDIVDDRIAIFNDDILKFENFKFFESEEFKILNLKQCLYKGVGSATIDHEKILADQFDCSLSEIDITSSEKHEFTLINNSNSQRDIVIYKSEEISIIKENLKDYIFNQTYKKSIELDFGDTNIDLKIDIKDFINESDFKNKIDILLNDNIKKIISSILDMKVYKSEDNFIFTK